jgi:hypothetical protein
MDNHGLKFRQRHEISFVFKTLRQALGLRPQIKLVPSPPPPWGHSVQDRKLTIHHHLVPSLRMSTATPQLHRHDFIAVTVTSATWLITLWRKGQNQPCLSSVSRKTRVFLVFFFCLYTNQTSRLENISICLFAALQLSSHTTHSEVPRNIGGAYAYVHRKNFTFILPSTIVHHPGHRRKSLLRVPRQIVE